VEAGGHNGADQLTTFTLIPMLVDKLDIPIIAAGGIVDGKGILAAFSLGAQGVQIGTRFAATIESSAHENYKKEIIMSGDQDTVLAFKKIGLVRLIKNDFAIRAMRAESNGWDENQLRKLLGIKRERMGIFEGDLIEGELEAGQGVGLINDVPTVKELFNRLIDDYKLTKAKLDQIDKF
jgi:enoyl-[acyl-carrier protein] reductase II